jgi:RNA polymerase sigma-70 factor, ECF subfamily
VPYESSTYLMAAGASPPGSRSLPELPPATAASSQDRNQRLTTAVTLHFDAVWRLLRRLGVREADVDDAAQQVFLALDRRLLDVPVERERSFLLSAAVRIAANARRQVRRSREDAGVDEESASDGTSPERALEHRQLMAELDQALSSLSDEQRTVFVLYEIEGRSLPEIARSLEIPLGTATSRLRRARDGFETWLAERRLREEQP